MAKDIFDKTIFDGYRVESLTESVQDIIPKYNFDGSTKTTVFISHKHDDLDEIKGLIGLLERKYNIKAYIDSLDKSMPKKTSGETASKIKQRINRCNKFILLATNTIFVCMLQYLHYEYVDMECDEEYGETISELKEKYGKKVVRIGITFEQLREDALYDKVKRAIRWVTQRMNYVFGELDKIDINTFGKKIKFESMLDEL